MRSLFIAAALSFSSTALADGATDFKTYCSTCHGDTGKGDGVASAALNPKPANFADAAFWATRDDAQVTKVIKEGGPSVGKSPLMAPFPQLSDEQVTAIVAHIKTLSQ